MLTDTSLSPEPTELGAIAAATLPSLALVLGLEGARGLVDAALPARDSNDGALSALNGISDDDTALPLLPVGSELLASPSL